MKKNKTNTKRWQHVSTTLPNVGHAFLTGYKIWNNLLSHSYTWIHCAVVVISGFFGYNLSSLHIITFPLSVCCEGIWSGPIDTTSRYIEFDTDRCPGHQKQCPITGGTRYVKKLQTSPSDFSNYCISKANISINIHVVNKKSMNYFAMLISLFSKKNNIELKIVILMIIFR